MIKYILIVNIVVLVIQKTYECINNYYKYSKEKHPSINWKCGKIISRQYWIKYHVETKYHYIYTAAVLADLAAHKPENI